MDRWELRESIRLSRDIFAQPAFEPFRAGEMEPGPLAQTDQQLDEFARSKADSAYHPSCTCAMGDPSRSESAVVDGSTMQVVGKQRTRTLRKINVWDMPLLYCT